MAVSSRLLAAALTATALALAACASSARTPRASSSAPAAIGPYSQAIEAGGFLFCSGQVGIDPATGALVPGDTRAQVEQTLKNLTAVLEAAGFSRADVVKTTVFLVDLDDFAAMNEVYARYFPDAPPARSTVQVARLPKGARVEIEATARARG